MVETSPADGAARATAGDAVARVMRGGPREVGHVGPSQQAGYVHPLTRAELTVLHDDAEDELHEVPEDAAAALLGCGTGLRQEGEDLWPCTLLPGDAIAVSVRGGERSR